MRSIQPVLDLPLCIQLVLSPSLSQHSSLPINTRHHPSPPVTTSIITLIIMSHRSSRTCPNSDLSWSRIGVFGDGDRAGRSMRRVDFFRRQRRWRSGGNANTFRRSGRRARWSGAFPTATSTTARTTLKPVSVPHTKDAYETHRSHDRGPAFGRRCGMSFEAGTTRRDSDSEAVGVGVVRKRS